MHNTGQRDINGVEIQEGDILSTGSKRKYVVFWDNAVAAFRVKYKESTGVQSYEFLYRIVKNYCTEIIGNVRDNPELLDEAL